MTNLSQTNYKTLKEQIKLLLTEGRKKAVASVNSILVQTYWHIGKHIVEYEQNGSQKAEIGRAHV